MSHLSKQEIQYEFAHADDNRGSSLIAAYAVCLSLACIAVMLRLVSRRKSKMALMADDWMSVVALLFTSVQVAVGLYAVHLGAGKHIIFLKDPVTYVKSFILIEIFYTIAAALIKFSTLLLYRRIFDCNRNFLMACYLVAAVVASYSTAQIVMSIFECTPVRKAWEPATPGTCLNTFIAATTPAAINVVADFATVFLPMPLIWGMQMQWRQKIQLIGIFMLGSFVIFASIWRAATMKYLTHLDISWDNVDPCLWSIVENGIGVLSTCLPTLRPLYALAVRGHYCRANEYCTRCHETPDHSKGWGRWKSASAGSGQSPLPGSVSTTRTMTDTESAWAGARGDMQETRLFSIIDRPL